MENLYPRAFLSENSLKFDEVKKYAVKIIKLQKNQSHYKMKIACQFRHFSQILNEFFDQNPPPTD